MEMNIFKILIRVFLNFETKINMEHKNIPIINVNRLGNNQNKIYLLNDGRSPQKAKFRTSCVPDNLLSFVSQYRIRQRYHGVL